MGYLQGDLGHTGMDREGTGIMEKIEQIILFDENGDGVWIADLVRCKDCALEAVCKFTQYQGRNGYCSYGERKEAEHE